MLDIEDLAVLEDYLRQAGRLAAGETASIRVLRGGVSNRTVLVERENGPGWVIKQALPKLRVKVDWFSDPARIEKEAEALRQLPALCPPGTITPLIFEDRANFVLAMEAVPQPHENWKTLLLAGRVEESHVLQFGRLLGIMHANAYRRRDSLAGIFDDRSFFESLRLEPYYAFTASQVPAARHFLMGLIEQTRARRLTIVHGDYSPKNVLVRENKLILLDHEVVHFGDPAFDVGFAMAHFLSKAHHLPAFRDEFRNAAGGFWKAYSQSLENVPWRTDLERMCVAHSLGCTLARVDGRSPLEYLTGDERDRQRGALIGLVAHPPATMNDLIGAFIERIVS